MGYGNWSTDLYRDRAEERKKSGVSDFAYHEVTRRAPVAERKCHPQMDPKGVTRESRDSDEHPTSLAIAVVLDQTGSMASTPVVMQKVLPDLMKKLIEGGCAHPQVLFGAVGDETNHERASLQIGQFESNVEMDEDLRRIYMEGQGGGQMTESYQNAMYFFARHTSIDCLEKRGEKGYLFLVGDEKPFNFVFKREVLKLMGDTIQDDIPIKEIVREVKEKYHVYFLIPAATNHFGNTDVLECWVSLLGGKEFVIEMPDASHICDTVTAVVTGAKPDTIAPRRRSARV